MPEAALFFVGVGVCAVVVGLSLFVVTMRRLSTNKHVLVTGRIDLVRTQVRAEAAERAVSAANARQMHAARLAADSVAVTGQALHVAREIAKVSRQMDALIGYVADEPGRHAIPGDFDLEREFLQ